MSKMQLLHKARPQKNLSHALQGEAFALKYIASHGEEVLPSEIGHEMDVSTARIAQTLNSIEKKGWITREINVNDRRKIIVRLTPLGRTEAEKHNQHILGVTEKMLRLLGEEDAINYVRITGKLAELLAKDM